MRPTSTSDNTMRLTDDTMNVLLPSYSDMNGRCFRDLVESLIR